MVKNFVDSECLFGIKRFKSHGELTVSVYLRRVQSVLSPVRQIDATWKAVGTRPQVVHRSCRRSWQAPEMHVRSAHALFAMERTLSRLSASLLNYIVFFFGVFIVFFFLAMVIFLKTKINVLKNEQNVTLVRGHQIWQSLSFAVKKNKVALSLRHKCSVVP